MAFDLDSFHFLRPAWLLVLPVAIGLWWLARKARDPLRGWRSVMDRELLEGLTLGRPRNERWRGGLG